MYSSKKISKLNAKQRRHVVFKDIISEELNANNKPDVFSSQASNSYLNEEVVKVSNISTEDPACIIHIESPQLENYPEYLSTEKDSINHLDNVYSRIQFICDQQKLLCSHLMNDYNDNDTFQHKILSNFMRTCVVAEVQTLPVLVLPVSMESQMKLTNSKSNEKINEKSNSIFSAANSIEISTQIPSEVIINHKETQAPLVRKPRTRSQSELTVNLKDPETSEVLLESSLRTINSEVEENNISEVVWGDVYNDYKKKLLEYCKKPPILKRNMIKPFTRINEKINKCTSLNSYIKSNTIKRTLEKYGQMKGDNLLAPDTAQISHGCTFQTKEKKTRNIEKMETKAYNQHFKKFYELHPFDDLVKSYMTSKDRRIKAVCSKIGCMVNMYGPIIRWQSDGSKKCQSPSNTKTFYYITVSANTKECLCRAVKCIQETFPKSSLKERSDYLPSLENFEDKIQI